jgi:hypothetical protein
MRQGRDRDHEARAPVRAGLHQIGSPIQQQPDHRHVALSGGVIECDPA